MKKVLFGLCSLAAGLVFTGCVATTDPGYGYAGYNDYPATYVGPAPGTVWIEGDLYFDHGSWRRHPGHWDRRGYRDGHYHNDYRGYGSPRSDGYRRDWR